MELHRKRAHSAALVRVCGSAQADSKSVSKGTTGWLVLYDHLPSYLVSIGLANDENSVQNVFEHERLVSVYPRLEYAI